MYAAEAAVWLGWALVTAARRSGRGLATQCAAFAQIAGWEERRLLSRFGAGYRAYLAQVPRRRREGPLPGHRPAAPDSENVPGRFG